MKSFDRSTALAPMTQWRDEITIIPWSGLQILDFGFRQSDIELKTQRFIERVTGMVQGPGGPQEEKVLIPLSGDQDQDEQFLAAAQAGDDEYSVAIGAALEPFLNSWVPVPVLRRKTARGMGGEELFDPGPSAWAQIRVVRLETPDTVTGHTHRVQLALDTALAPKGERLFYPAPDREDALGSREFRFVSDPGRMDWFLRRLEPDGTGGTIDPQAWVSDRLDEVFMAMKRAERPGRRLTHEMLPHRLEHWARYLAFLRVLDHAINFPLFRLCNTVGENDAVQPVSVDLVLDVGNSRTCGILIERLPGEGRIDPARSYSLEVRDLSRPEFLYTGLMESRVEFSEFLLCEEKHLRRARRPGGFMWPSPVRIGAEALRLVAGDAGTETVSGLSSPKRYLWDDQPVRQDWRFHNHSDPGSLPRAARSAMRFLNMAGDVIKTVVDDEGARLRPRRPGATDPAGRPQFSRSSLFGFLLAEIIAHALVQVNAPASRARRPQSDQPRRIDRIILTLPTATSIQEQAIMRFRAKGALSLIWSMLGQSGQSGTTSLQPELIVDWDEASCTQVVYLYSEIAQKFDGRIDQFLQLKGRPRPRTHGAPPEPSLRIACMDVGGGTTDLMITTCFGQENRVLHPEQTFREGFRVAGDDLLQRIIASIILPALEDAISLAGGANARGLLLEAFAGDIGGQEQQNVQRRRQFALRVLQPLALHLTTLCETAGEFESLKVPVAEVLGLTRDPEGVDDLPRSILDYIEEPARRHGASNFRLADCELHCDRAQVDAIARETFQKVFGNMAEVIDHLGVDIVLLTGRPSRLPALRSILEEMLIIPPSRLVSMHSYRTGRWYPFRDPVSQRIGDPKSTVAVGGMLIALLDSRIPNFKIASSAFKMRSTANYFGEIDSSGQIPNDRVHFHGAEMQRGDETAQIRMFAPVFLGARQLKLERWTTTPMYRLDFRNGSNGKAKLPLIVTLQRAEFDGDPDDNRPEAGLRREAAREAFSILEVADAEDTGMKTSDVELRLQTLGFADDYWIDTGLFRF